MQAECALARARHRLEQALNLPTDRLESALTSTLEEPEPGTLARMRRWRSPWSAGLDTRSRGFAPKRPAAARPLRRAASETSSSARATRATSTSRTRRVRSWRSSSPIFDQQQAALAAAAFEEQQALHRVQAQEARARREVADALRRCIAAARSRDPELAGEPGAAARAGDYAARDTKETWLSTSTGCVPRPRPSRRDASS